MLVVSSKSNLGCEAGCGLSVSWSDYARIMLESFSNRPRIGNEVSSVFKDFLRNLGMEFCVAGAIFGDVGRPVAPRTVNDVSYVMRIQHVSLSAWQAQYLVKCKCYFPWQAQYLVKI